MKLSTIQGVAAILAGAAALAFAAPAVAVQNGAADETSLRAAVDAAGRDPNRMICVRTRLSGSRMVQRICKTAAEWEHDGQIPDDR